MASQRLTSFVVSAIAVVAAGVSMTLELRAQPSDKPALTGGWTLNQNLSDQPFGRGENGGPGRRGGRGGGGGRGGRRGGFGGGGGAPIDREARARQQEALADILNPPSHLVISDTGTMIVMTGPDGRTTRFSPDGKKVKDENTGAERKTKWDAGKLVSEIDGLGPSKMVQTFTVNAEPHQLSIVVEMEGDRDGQKRTRKHVYDSDAGPR